MGYIYKISNNINSKVYIGSTKDLNKRWNDHKSSLIKNKHYNKHLQRFVNKYGIDTLTFSIIEKVDDNNNLLIREQIYIDMFLNKFTILHSFI